MLSRPGRTRQTGRCGEPVSTGMMLLKGTTAELNKVLVDFLAGRGKLPEPVKEELVDRHLARQTRLGRTVFLAKEHP